MELRSITLSHRCLLRPFEECAAVTAVSPELFVLLETVTAAFVLYASRSIDWPILVCPLFLKTILHVRGVGIVIAVIQCHVPCVYAWLHW